MKNKIYCAIFFVTIFLIQPLRAQHIDTAKLDSLFDKLNEKNKAMGSIAISKNGKILYERSIGYAVISEKETIKASYDTKYRIASITKMFTATMIFQLVEEKKLTLATTIEHYFPELPNARIITISNLLNHRSGLANYTSIPGYETWAQSFRTENEMLSLIEKNKVDFQPNEKTVYSNSNYLILGYIIERITKKSYDKNLKDRIVSKIQLTETYVGGLTDVKKKECFSYQYFNGWVQEAETDMKLSGGAGCIVSTPRDLAHFIEALFSFKLISQTSLEQMKTIKDGYGMGMMPIPFYDKKGLGHGGSRYGFRSMLTYFAEDSLAIAYCTNGEVYLMNNILIGALCIYFDKPYTIPTFNVFYIKPEVLDTYTGVYTNEEIPLNITITRDSTSLIAQATGQPAFLLEAVEINKFKSDPTKAKIEFRSEEKELILKQGGGIYVFTKKD